ncbi:transglutaminase domain-containing protein [Alicyclobacillus kakegawensis]|uniref:transglutaminase domain-containing protein n=1 Tax=Alicyclobacillus kakegawensis TaxID=392012 RepID=UPI00082B459C|nr:transglutaminase domain-containing protein [Alicyclobacillus kakegawensis]
MRRLGSLCGVAMLVLFGWLAFAGQKPLANWLAHEEWTGSAGSLPLPAHKLEMPADGQSDEEVLDGAPMKVQTATHVAQVHGSAPPANYKKEIYRHLEQRASSFTLTWPHLRSVGEAEQAFRTAAAADPYVDWNISRWTVECTWLASKDTVRFYVKYRESKAESAFVNTRVHKILRQIIKPGMLDFQKEKAIHDWIVQHVQYDVGGTRYTAYDALASGKAVCQGYALLAYRMLTDAGIPTRIITGTADGSHMWNEVKLHGRWYQLDVTWDDPLGDRPKDVSYAYFNLTDAQLAKDHHWDHQQGPAAVTDFVHELRTLESSDKAHKSVYASLLNVLKGRH